MEKEVLEFLGKGGLLVRIFTESEYTLPWSTVCICSLGLSLVLPTYCPL